MAGNRLLLLSLWLVIGPATAWNQGSSIAAAAPWYIDSLAIPRLKPLPGGKPIVIAVIDDGFNLTHPRLRDFWYHPPGEIDGNRQDDDGNGYRDDHLGWDVSDHDNDVAPPEGRESIFYHGSFLCGVLTDLLTRTYGPAAADHFRLLPVKALPDQAGQTYLRDGYRGIAYALSLRPDIILCAWNGGGIGPEEEALFAQARRQGVAVVASAGNFFSERAEPPAAVAGVIAVAAVDSLLRKTDVSNYGMFVDLTGPGQSVIGAAATGDGERVDGATSAAAAVVAAALAILKQAAPRAGPDELLAALQNTAHPLDAENRRYAGKLGSGFPDIQAAVDYLTADPACCRRHNPALPEGVLTERLLPARVDSYDWTIAPDGDFAGIWFEAVPSDRKDKARLLISARPDSLLADLPLAGPDKRVFVPGNRALLRYRTPRRSKPLPFALRYYVETIDSTTLYCRGLSYFENPRGEITDGSGAEPYANGCDCKWQINLAPGQRIHLRFTAFDTQAKADFVYLFDGDSPIPANLIARFSGGTIPPEVTSRTNRVLVWFVTDSAGAGRGWTLHYESVE